MGAFLRHFSERNSDLILVIQQQLEDLTQPLRAASCTPLIGRARLDKARGQSVGAGYLSQSFTLISFPFTTSPPPQKSKLNF